MKNTDSIIEIAQNNNGVITTSMVVEAGISRGILKYLVDKGRLEKSERGVYILPEVLDDEIYNLQNRFKRGIFSHETALYLWDLTDRTPNNYDMTFPSSYNLTNPKHENIKCTQCKKEWYYLGLDVVNTPSGNEVYTYNIERTLCDILRSNHNSDIQIVSESFKRYVARKDKNLSRLSEYAKIFNLEEKIQSYLEVLL